MDHEKLIAIDIHTHAEVSCWNPFDNYGEEYDRAADKYFGNGRRPTIAETMAYYRERNLGLVMFTVDSESQLGRRRIPNEEIAEAARANSDMMVAFASIDPHKGRMGAREARRLIEEEGVRGFKFHPTVQGFHPYDRMAWPIYEVVAEYQLPAIFHTGHSGIGSGMRCGGGLRLAYSNPMHLDDVAIDFPDMQIVMAHPSSRQQRGGAGFGQLRDAVARAAAGGQQQGGKGGGQRGRQGAGTGLVDLSVHVCLLGRWCEASVRNRCVAAVARIRIAF